MFKGIMLLGDGFEQVEALATQDVLNRTGEIKTTLVSIMGRLDVVSSSKVIIKAEKLVEEIDVSEYDFIILPGGKVGVDNLTTTKSSIDTILEFNKQGKYQFAICAAPSIYGMLGILNNKTYTCFPGFQRGNGTWIDDGVVKDGKIITARSMGYSIPFAEEIVRTLLGEEAVLRISVGIYGLNE